MTGIDVLAFCAQALPNPETLNSYAPSAVIISQMLLWERSVRIKRTVTKVESAVDEIRRALRLRSTLRKPKNE